MGRKGGVVSMSGPSYTANYTDGGDGVGLRVQESNNPNPDRWVQYDGVRPVLEGTLSGDTFTTLNRYIGEGDSYYSPPISPSIGGENRFYLLDGLGSTRQLLNDSQTVTDTYSYEAFGNLLGSTGTTSNPYKYVGSLGYYQTGSSLMHLGARYYMPEIGRFTACDVFKGHSATHDYNYYGYAAGNPVMRTDPDGRQWIEILEIVSLLNEANTVIQASRTFNRCVDFRDVCGVCWNEDCQEKLRGSRAGFGLCQSTSTQIRPAAGGGVVTRTVIIHAVCTLNQQTGQTYALNNGQYAQCPISSRVGTRPPG